jgi:hypothetical protein
VLADPASRRHGATPLNAVVHETPRGITAYALWHTKGEWTPTGPNGEVQVREVIAADPQAYLALWRMLLSIDLTRITTYSFAAVDESLLHLVDHPRRLGGRLNESLRVRLVDVPRALAARRYAAPVDVVLEATDPLLYGNAGRWRSSPTGNRPPAHPRTHPPTWRVTCWNSVRRTSVGCRWPRSVPPDGYGS